MAFRVNDLQTVEDLTSEVFMRLLGALHDKNAPQKTLRGWLFGVASRIVKEHYREKKRTPLAPLDESLPGPTISLDQSIETSFRYEQLQAEITNLTEDQQQVLALRYGYGMPVRDVAETMNKSEGSVKMLQVRAIAALTRKLSDTEMSL